MLYLTGPGSGNNECFLIIDHDVVFLSNLKNFIFFMISHAYDLLFTEYGLLFESYKYYSKYNNFF